MKTFVGRAQYGLRFVAVFGACLPPYADTFARLSHQNPFAVSREVWERAVNDAGVFLDAWGALAAAMHWRAGDLFDVPRDGRPGGLAWQLKGESVASLGDGHACLKDGRTIRRA